MSDKSHPDHPWNRFLFARHQMIIYLSQEGKTNEEIAISLSMDGPEHVQAIVNAMENIQNHKKEIVEITKAS